MHYQIQNQPLTSIIKVTTLSLVGFFAYVGLVHAQINEPDRVVIQFNGLTVFDEPYAVVKDDQPIAVPFEILSQVDSAFNIVGGIVIERNQEPSINYKVVEQDGDEYELVNLTIDAYETENTELYAFLLRAKNGDLIESSEEALLNDSDGSSSTSDLELQTLSLLRNERDRLNAPELTEGNDPTNTAAQVIVMDCDQNGLCPIVCRDGLAQCTAASRVIVSQRLGSNRSAILAERVGVQSRVDADGDGITDYDELNIYRTDPDNPDTDGDGMYDGDEVLAGTSLTSNSVAPRAFQNPRNVAGQLLNLMSISRIAVEVSQDGAPEKLIFTGSGPANSYLTLYVFNGTEPIIANTRVDSNSAFRYALDRVLEDGVYEAQLAVTGREGKIISVTDAVTFTKSARVVKLEGQDVEQRRGGFFTGSSALNTFGALVLLLALSVIGLLAMRRRQRRAQ